MSVESNNDYLDTIILEIAEFKICLQAEDLSIIKLDNGIIPFIKKRYTGHCDIMIRCYSGIPVSLCQNDNLLFSANNQAQQFFSIHRHNDLLRFIVYNQEEGNTIQQIGILDKDMTEWTIYCNHIIEDDGIFPLAYPMCPLILYYLTVRFNAVMIHASGVYDGLFGRGFTGFSGRGKSTIAKIWEMNGATIINDDRLMIRKSESGLFMYNTPMYYAAYPVKSRLNSLFIIEHASLNRLERIKFPTSIAKILAFCIQHGYNEQIIQHHVDFISEICQELTVYRLGFVPDKSVIELVKENGA